MLFQVTRLDSSHFWIGLLQESVGGYYVWVDKSMLVYTNWAGSQPDSANGQESCVKLDHTIGNITQHSNNF